MAHPLTFDLAGKRGGIVAAWPDRLLDLSAAAALALLPFQNSFLQSTPLGGFGAPLSVLPIMAFGFLAVLRAAALPRAVVVPRVVLLALLYIGLVTISGLVVYDFSYKGISLLVKAALAAVQWVFLAIGVLAGMRCPPSLARRALTFSWLVNLIGLALFRGDPNATSEAAHVIGFSSEPSHFGLVTAIIGLWLASLTEQRTLRWCILASTVLAILMSGSKGALAVLGLVIVVAGLVRARHDRRRLLQLIPLLIIGAGGLLALAVSQIQYDIANFTSTVTRLSGVVTALYVARHHPLGVGLGGFYPAFATTVPQTWPMIGSLFGINIDFSELLAFAYSDDRNLSAKALLFDTLIYFGWPGAVALLGVTGTLAFRWMTDDGPRSVWLAMALCFAILAMSTYSTVMPMYVIPMTFGFAWTRRA